MSLFWFIQTIIISFLIIAMIHYFFLYLQDNLTVTKTKDMMYKPKEFYKEIYDTIQNKEDKLPTENNTKNITISNDTTCIDDLPNIEEEIIELSNDELLPNTESNVGNNTNMKDELKNFLKEQLNDDNDD
jgi:hypothetical protein